MLQINAHLLYDHIELLFSHGDIRVGPAVGKWELKGRIRVFQFELTTETGFEGILDIGSQNIANPNKGHTLFFAVSEYFLVDEDKSIGYPTTHKISFEI